MSTNEPDQITVHGHTHVLKSVNQAPPTPAEMLRIALGLTVVCLIAAVILAFFYYITQPAKEHNQLEREQRTIRQLLNLGPEASIDEVRRYLHWRGNELEVLYLANASLAHLDDDGAELARLDVPDEIRVSTSGDAKDTWVRGRIAGANEESLRYVGRFFVGREKGAAVGYVIEGISVGYKTFIRFFLALDSQFRLQGLEIVHHEEDPGLGDEITQPYFKNQFAGRTRDQIATLEVTKDPLPKEWKLAVESLPELGFGEWLKQFEPEIARHPNIYAITGATISSEAVSDGVKRALGNFLKRMQSVERYL